MPKYLVTGGCGFIGSHLVDALFAYGHTVRILDDLSTGTVDYKPKDVELMVGDVSDPDTTRAAMKGVDGCFHLAAIPSVERSITDWIGTHRTNLTGTIAVFDAARRAGALPVVFASSAAVYGDHGDVMLDEGADPRPLSSYGADKLGGELHAAVASHVHKIPNTALRFFNVYGPRQNPKSPYSGVISIFCDRMKQGREIAIFGDGQQTRDFIFVGDVVAALLAAMERCSSPAGVFNVCTGHPTSVRGLADHIGGILGSRPAVRFSPARQGEIRHSVGNPARAQRGLGFTAATGLVAGLMPTLQALSANPVAVQPTRQTRPLTGEVVPFAQHRITLEASNGG
ncbi:MAG: NAD-dependent epimerase/dehydratase family protein [Alphaproteobacteria bacterium]|nr:NAD-dependent epimerase/dehydratase family protein [Alphaproteobacteria bacterium]